MVSQLGSPDRQLPAGRGPLYGGVMGRSFESITDAMRAFIDEQPVFFVATAPREGGRVNVSPKGYDSFRVLGEHQVCYLDLTGSGAETIAHLRDNGRITFMFCAFEGKPNVVRLYGSGRYVRPGDPEFDDLIDGFPKRSGVRGIVVVDIDRTSTSCGYSVPFMDYVEDRQRLEETLSAKDDGELEEYRATKNAASIDGLPALD